MEAKQRRKSWEDKPTCKHVRGKRREQHCLEICWLYWYYKIMIKTKYVEINGITRKMIIVEMKTESVS